ncbi:unnamed protein product [Coccothraustes coccothraustes]
MAFPNGMTHAAPRGMAGEGSAAPAERGMPLPAAWHPWLFVALGRSGKRSDFPGAGRDLRGKGDARRPRLERSGSGGESRIYLRETESIRTGESQIHLGETESIRTGRERPRGSWQ